MGLLDEVKTGKEPNPPRIVIYGGPKVGKSTFASGAEDALFIQTEDGLDALDVARIDCRGNLPRLKSALRELYNEDHSYKTLVIDSADWLEADIWAWLCEDAGAASIDELGGGYGKGYNRAREEWDNILTFLDALRSKKGMTIVFIAHHQVRRMEAPDSEPYDYSALKLHKHAAALLEEWADLIGFVRVRTDVEVEDAGFGKKRGRAASINDGERVVTVRQDPAYVTGNRYGIKADLPLDWKEFRAAIAAAFADDS